MFIIGIDPHKGSHTAAVIDGDEQLVGEVRVRADRRNAIGLLAFAARFEPRCWAIEGATGTARCWRSSSSRSARPCSMCRRRSRRGRGCSTRPATTRPTRTTPARPRSSRCGTRNLRAVGARGPPAVLRLLAKRHHHLVAHRTRAICRLHAVLCQLIAGGLAQESLGETGRGRAAPHPPADAIGIERRRLAVELLDEVRRADRDLVELKRRIDRAVTASATTVTDVLGVGPIVAAYLIGYSGDVRRFPTAGHYARYNATAPIEASSGPNASSSPQPEREPPAEPRDPHRRGHPDQPRHTRPRLLPPQTSRREDPQRSDARLKRRISDAVYRQLRADTDPLNETGPGGQPGTTLNPAWPANPEHRHFGTATPEPEHQRYAHPPTRVPRRAREHTS